MVITFLCKKRKAYDKANIKNQSGLMHYRSDFYQFYFYCSSLDKYCFFLFATSSL